MTNIKKHNSGKNTFLQIIVLRGKHLETNNFEQEEFEKGKSGKGQFWTGTI